MGGGIRHFGTLADGREVQAVTLRAGDISATLLTWGAVLQDLRLTGMAHGLTMGSDRIADYQGKMRHHGALIGPVVNRLTGASAPIAGRLHRFDPKPGTRLTLHSGSAGTHLKLWHLADAGPDHATLALTLPDGEGGFPGTRQVTARFTVTAPASLRMEVTATTDAPTILNFANHSYWNLDGTPDWSGHHLHVLADRYLPTDPDFAPTGEIRPVAGTPMDFREGRVITPRAPDLDNCFCLADAPRPLTDVLWLTGRSGLTMTVATTEPGIQLYDGRNAIRPGHKAHEGIAIEAQGWPDAPNHKGFPGITVLPDQPLRQVTEWRFGRG